MVCGCWSALGTAGQRRADFLLTNATIKRAVRDYLNGGARKQRVVTKYGDISNWDVSNVTNMEEVFCGENFLTVRVTQALVSFAPCYRC